VLGGLRTTSDLDILAVVDRSTTEDERRAMLQRLLEISGRRATRGPARPVELTVVQQSQVRPWRYQPDAEFLYGEWLRDEYEAGRVPAPEPTRDLAMLITDVLAGNRPLLGPPPGDVLDPVPEADVRRAIVEGIPGLLADLDSDTRNVLLTLARTLATLETGEILMAKDAAAELVAHRLPAGVARDVLLLARQMYLDGVNDEDAGPAWAGTGAAAREAATGLVSEIAGFALE
jgi:streptomycin 3"-adenylyltransferase